MVKCPRCDFAVDETTRTTCPLCFTPLNVEGTAEAATAPETAAVAPEAMPTPEPMQTAAALGASPVPIVPVAPSPSEIPVPPQQAQPQVPVMPPPPVMPQMPQQQQQMPGMQQTQGGGMPPPQAVPQAPQYTPGSTPRPGMRVSLTGEMIEDSAPAAAAPSYTGGSAPPRTGPRPAPAKGKGSGVRGEMTDEQMGTPGSPVAAIILTIMLLAVLGYGSWYFISKRTNPKDQTTKYWTAVKQQDWKTLYTVVELSDDDKKRLPDAEAFEKDAQAKVASSPMAAQLPAILKDLKFTVGEPKVEEKTATVPVTLTVKFQGQEMPFPVSMELVDKGGWKVKPNDAAMGVMGGGGMGR